VQRFPRALVVALVVAAVPFLLGVPGASASGPKTTRVTQHGSTEANGDAAGPVVSATGQFVAYESAQTNLVGGAGSSGDNVFWWNRKTGTTKLVSHALMAGQTPDGQSFGANISADGRYVSFESDATNLVANDNNGVSDAFVWDSHTGKIIDASVSTTGVRSNGDSGDVSMSPDGRYVAFSTNATNLGPGNHDIFYDVYVRDLVAHTTTRASVAIGNHAVDGDSIETCMSNADVVGFGSRSNFLVSHAQPDANEVYVRNIPAHTTTEVSVNASGTPGDMNAFQCDISANGRYVAFDSYSSNLSTKDGDASDVFLRDVTAGRTYLASIGHDGSPADNDSSIPSVSDDGRFVAFQSTADNLISGDGNHQQDVFRYDRTTHSTKRLSVSTAGQAGNNSSYDVELSGDGSWAVFTSSADNLVPNDTVGHVDVFERGPLPT
jgi:Tol biopolymer transport system component